MHEELTRIPFELKELTLSEDGNTGTFTGIASVYGNKDLGGDVVDRGAFSQTIAQRGNKVRLMDSHRVRIGMAEVEDTPIGLKASGFINLKKQSGAEAYSDLKFYQEKGMPMGMSIGYETIQADHDTKDGARHLKEVRLWEVTVTEFPMNELATVTSVKSSAISDLISSVKAARGNSEQKDDFNTELQEIQLYSARWQMQQALCSALEEIINDPTITDKAAASRESIQQFSDAYTAMIPDYVALTQTDQDAGDDGDLYGFMSRQIRELKQGRILSASNRDMIAACIKQLQALLDAQDEAETPAPKAAAAAETKSESSGTSPEAAEKPEAADKRPAISPATFAELKGVFDKWQ